MHTSMLEYLNAWCLFKRFSIKKKSENNLIEKLRENSKFYLPKKPLRLLKITKQSKKVMISEPKIVNSVFTQEINWKVWRFEKNPTYF